MRIKCLCCDKIVSTEVPDDTVIRAWIECPECIENDTMKKKYPEEKNKKNKAMIKEDDYYGDFIIN